MNILTRYLLREFYKLLCFFIFGFILVYIVFDIIENAGRFAQAGMTIAGIASYMMLQIPEIVSLLTPVAVLMATIISLGVMDNRNELVAMKASGISLLRFTVPVLLSAFAISVALTALNETILPDLKAQTSYIREVIVKNREPNVYYKDKFWHKGQNSIYEIGSYDPENQVLLDVTYYGFDQDFNLDIRIDAQRAQYVNNHWRFYMGLYQKMESHGNYAAHVFHSKDMLLPEVPDDFTRLAKPTSEMNMVELADLINKIEVEGYDARSYKVDMYAKMSSPLSCLVIAFIGIPLVLFRSKGKENRIARAIVIGSALALFYWVGSSFIASTLGYQGLIPPFLAAWLPNILFIMLGLWLYSHTPQ